MLLWLPVINLSVIKLIYSWQKHQSLQDQKRNRNFHQGQRTDVFDVAEAMDLCVISVFAEYVSGSLPTKE